MTKLKTILLAGAALSMVASQARAKGGILHFTCEPGFDSVSGTKSGNVLSSTVERLSREGHDIWIINYRMANGTVVSRNDQYDVTRDSSLPDGRHGWTGRLRSNPSLEMDGEIAKGGVNGHVYTERLWDNANDHKLIMRTVAQCTRVTDLATLTPYPASTPNLNDGGRSGETIVPMVSNGGTFAVPVTINGQLTLNFIVDSGAADVSIPADVVLTLVRTGTITDADFLGKQSYQMADGSTVPSQQFLIRSLKVGDKVLENVTGSIAPVAGSLLLGQSFLTRFNSWSIDNHRRALILS
jgi:predicted aspartyl protease